MELCGHSWWYEGTDAGGAVERGGVYSHRVSVRDSLEKEWLGRSDGCRHRRLGSHRAVAAYDDAWILRD